MDKQDYAACDLASLVHPYINLEAHQKEGPLVIGRGEGVRVFDTDGKAYIEGMSGLWCTALGFSERRLIDAAVRAKTSPNFICRIPCNISVRLIKASFQEGSD